MVGVAKVQAQYFLDSDSNPAHFEEDESSGDSVFNASLASSSEQGDAGDHCMEEVNAVRVRVGCVYTYGAVACPTSTDLHMTIYYK